MQPPENIKYPSPEEENIDFQKLFADMSRDEIKVLYALLVGDSHSEDIDYVYEILNYESEIEVFSREQIEEILKKLASSAIGVISLNNGQIYRNTAFFTFLDGVVRAGKTPQTIHEDFKSSQQVFPWLAERFSVHQQHVLAAVMLLSLPQMEKQQILDYIASASEGAHDVTPFAMTMAELDAALAELAEQGVISLDESIVQRIDTQFFEELERDLLGNFSDT
jgi:hypothetical protein